MGTVDLIPTFKYHDIFTSHEVLIIVIINKIRLWLILIRLIDIA